MKKEKVQSLIAEHLTKIVQKKNKERFSFPSKYHSLTTNTIRNYFLKKEGFFETFVVLVLRCRKIAND
jgi:hypothetical protein